MFIRKASSGKSWNGIFTFRELTFHLSYTKVTDVRIHDKLHSKAKRTTRTIHDEQCTREFHNITGITISTNSNLNILTYLIYLQVVSNRETNETLLCIAYVFEVANSNCGAQHHIYRLVKDQSQHWVIEK